MGSDLLLVIHWWGTLFLVGAAAFPLTRALFGDSKGITRDADRRRDIHLSWWDEGYLFSKAVGMAAVTYFVYLAGTLRVLPFSSESISVALGVVFLGGIVLNRPPFAEATGGKVDWGKKIGMILVEEVFFFIALLFWSWVKGHEPSIHGLEKFMDFGFTKSILNSTYFPPADMWYAGFPINYYYFGHMVMAVLTKLSGLDLAYTFNLMLASIFALTFTMSFSIGKQLIKGIGEIREIWGGLFTAFLVTFVGNMQTLYAFTKGYTGDNVVGFWELFWPLAEFWQKLPEGLNRYWYANATRFIPFTIHEFPSYSFVVSDVHGHVLSLPFVLLAIGLLIAMFRPGIFESKNYELGSKNYEWLRIIFYGFLVGVLLMTNALDGPIYLGLFLILFILHNLQFIFQKKKDWKKIALPIVTVLVAAVSSLPFLFHFQSFVHGLAINCPPAFLANTKIGPLLFEGAEKCQHSPIWMLLILWGFFIYCGLWLIFGKIGGIRAIRRIRGTEGLLVVFFLFSLLLIIFPEFFYFKDIYPAHFRSNTMFKLGYQAFILFSIVSGYTIVQFISDGFTRIKSRIEITNQSRMKKIFLIFLLPQLFLVSIYPIFSVRSYFGELREYKGLDGAAWLKLQYPDDYVAITWLNAQPNNGALVEADGDSYTDYNHFSSFTGMPTVVGWAVHEWLWRGGYDVVVPRREEVRLIYESKNLDQTKQVLAKYHVRYIIVGTLERSKFKNLDEKKITKFGKSVFRSGETVVYQVE